MDVRDIRRRIRYIISTHRAGYTQLAAEDLRELYENVLEEIAGHDFRGNRSTESQLALEALKARAIIKSTGV